MSTRRRRTRTRIAVALVAVISLAGALAIHRADDEPVKLRTDETAAPPVDTTEPPAIAEVSPTSSTTGDFVVASRGTHPTTTSTTVRATTTTTVRATTTTTRPAEAPAVLSPGIYAVGVDGSGLHRLVDTGSEQNLPHAVFSPDGARLAYTLAGAVHVMDLGGQDRVIGSGPRGPWSSSVSWAPDSQHVAFVGPSGSSRCCDIWVGDASGATPPRPLGTPGDSTVAWGPDGRLATAGDGGVFVFDPDGGQRLRISADPSANSLLAWSPDGRDVFIANPTRYRPGRDGRAVPYPAKIVAADGGHARLVATDDPYFVDLYSGTWTASWSPASDRVLITGTLGARTGAWLVSATDGAATFVGEELEGARLSPDGAMVAASLWSHGGSSPGRLVTLKPDGTGRHTVLDAPPHLSVHDVAWSPDSKTLAVVLQSYMPLGGAGHGPDGWATRPPDSGARCGTPSGPDGYGAATTAVDGSIRLRLTVYPCQLYAAEGSTEVVRVDSPYTVILSAHLDYGDGSSSDFDYTYQTACNRKTGDIVIRSDGTYTAIGVTEIRGDNHRYTTPGRYDIKATVTAATCTSWDENGHLREPHTVTVLLPIFQLDQPLR